MSTLILTPDHVYMLDGRQIEGFSETIKAAGLTSDFYNETGRSRGQKVHEMTEAWDRGEEILYNSELSGYLESWKKFREAMNYEPIEAEFITHHPILRVGTTIDRIPGPLDIKTGSPEPWHIFQIALQWDTLNYLRMNDCTKEPIDVYLDKDGKSPRVVNYSQREMRTAFATYSSIVCFLRWKKENKYS